MGTFFKVDIQNESCFTTIAKPADKPAQSALSTLSEIVDKLKDNSINVEDHSFKDLIKNCHTIKKRVVEKEDFCSKIMGIFYKTYFDEVRETMKTIKQLAFAFEQFEQIESASKPELPLSNRQCLILNNQYLLEQNLKNENVILSHFNYFSNETTTFNKARLTYQKIQDEFEKLPGILHLDYFQDSLKIICGFLRLTDCINLSHVCKSMYKTTKECSGHRLEKYGFKDAFQTYRLLSDELGKIAYSIESFNLHHYLDDYIRKLFVIYYKSEEIDVFRTLHHYARDTQIIINIACMLINDNIWAPFHKKLSIECPNLLIFLEKKITSRKKAKLIISSIVFENTSQTFKKKVNRFANYAKQNKELEPAFNLLNKILTLSKK